MTSRPPTRPALRLIVAYKLVRAAAALAAAALLFALALTGRTDELRAVAHALRHHVTSAWAMAAADALVRATTPRHVWLATLALTLDGSVTFVEGWGLHRGWRWAPWLVVGLTCALVQFEVRALAHHVSASRIALLVANVAIAVYLARRALAETRHARA